MPATREDLMAELARLGIETTTLKHPALHTVEESRKLRGDIPGAHIKNLFLKCKKGTLWLIVTLENAEINLKTFNRKIGSGRLSFGRPDLLMDVLGVTPGSVTPFALINDPTQKVTVVLDENLLAFDIVNAHPLTNEATTSIARDDLLAFIAACGHQPRIMPVGSGPDSS